MICNTSVETIARNILKTQNNIKNYFSVTPNLKNFVKNVLDHKTANIYIFFRIIMPSVFQNFLKILYLQSYPEN